MGSFLDDFSCMEYGNYIAEAAGSKPMADINACFVTGDFIEIQNIA